MITSKIVRITDSRFPLAARILTSLEGENPGGSIKDHMVVGELNELIEQGRLGPGDRVSEISAGSTALSLAHYCKQLSLKCVLFVPDSLPDERLKNLESLGAEVHRFKMDDIFREYDSFCSQHRVHPFAQLKDASKFRFYLHLGHQVEKRSGKVDAVIGSVGTGHSLKGVAAGIQGPPPSITAEPHEGSVPGIRNIERERHGPEDACQLSWFTKRFIHKSQDYFEGTEIMTDHGLIQTPESFRLVLASAREYLRQADTHEKTLFLVGAANRRILP